jgi:hypothetical protein
MKSSSSSLLLLSAGRRYEPILVETAIPCGDDKAQWQSSSSSSSSWQTLSTTATLFQLALTTSAMVGCVAALVGLASLDAHVVTMANNGCLIFALVWSGLTALTAYLVFERLVGKSKAATAAVAATDETMTYRLLSDEPNDDVTQQCEHELPPPPQPCHAKDEQQQQHDSRTSTVFVWGTYVSFSVTCLLHDIVTTMPMHSVSLPHYWLYGAVTVLTILTGASVIVLPQRTTTTTTTTSTMDSGDFGGSSHFGQQASAGDNPDTNRMSLCAPETV